MNAEETENQIKLYENDISILEKMKSDYEKTSGLLCGAFYSDMIDEIDSQIEFAKECIGNLKK